MWKMKSTCFLLIPLGISMFVQYVQSEEYREEHKYGDFDLKKDKNHDLQLTSNHVTAGGEDKDFIDEETRHLRDPEEFEGFREASHVETFQKFDASSHEYEDEYFPFKNWYCYYVEIGLLAGVAIYIYNYFSGKEKNQKLATAWYRVHEDLLLENFSRVGDSEKNHQENHLLKKHTEYTYSVWCTGRTCCKGMHVELRLLKRQDLLSVMMNTIERAKDEVHIRVEMNLEDMDSVVFCLASKKTALRLSRELPDLSEYCSERKRGDKFGLPSRLYVLLELNEVAFALLDSRVSSVVNRLGDYIDYIYISDQFSGTKSFDYYRQTKYPDTTKILFFGFFIPNSNLPESKLMENIFPLHQLVFYMIDRLKKYRLSKDAKSKAEKNRQRVRAEFSKMTHAFRNQAAAARKEEKKRQEKEKILLVEDPEKQKKWEDREMKRMMKKKAAKMRRYTTL